MKIIGDFLTAVTTYSSEQIKYYNKLYYIVILIYYNTVAYNLNTKLFI